MSDLVARLEILAVDYAGSEHENPQITGALLAAGTEISNLRLRRADLALAAEAAALERAEAAVSVGGYDDPADKIRALITPEAASALEVVRAEAVKAERERCHRIALDHRPDRPLQSRATATAIATAIMEG